MLQSGCGWFSSSRDPLGWGWILPSVAHGNGCKAGLLPPACMHCNDFGVPWGATRLLGAEGTVQSCCHSSPVPRGSVVSPGGDRCCAKATWILCPPRVRSRTQSQCTGLVLGRRGEFPSSSAFSVAQEFRMGVHRETGRWGSPFQRSHHPHFPSQPPWVARGGGGHPQACVPMRSHGDAAHGSGLV